jgi:hypothetical protein
LNPSFDEEMRAAFYKLTRVIYLDQEPFSIQHRPNLVRLFDPLLKNDQKKQAGTEG